MIFLLLFIAGGMVLPLILDSRAHRGDNIFRRSGRDILAYAFVKKAFQALHLSTRRVGATVAAVVALGVLFVAVYLAFKLVGLAVLVLGWLFS